MRNLAPDYAYWESIEDAEGLLYWVNAVTGAEITVAMDPFKVRTRRRRRCRACEKPNERTNSANVTWYGLGSIERDLART